MLPEVMIHDLVKYCGNAAKRCLQKSGKDKQGRMEPIRAEIRKDEPLLSVTEPRRKNSKSEGWCLAPQIWWQGKKCKTADQIHNSQPQAVEGVREGSRTPQEYIAEALYSEYDKRSAHSVAWPSHDKAILIFNNHNKPQLSKFYQPYSKDTQQQIIRETFHLVSKRYENVCNVLERGFFIGGSNNKLIYRHDAMLYFVFCMHSSESNLGILDLIQAGFAGAPAHAVSAVKNMNLPESPRNRNIGDISMKVPNLPF
ncbi:AP-3 complex subunit sigma-1-like [Tupaia chinensis]|uniref:AP-3 complex subunit sigma-1-like n=1 Tax=Tupaia chinensis TaxID=246437 RepID=UPI000FFC66DD|nr:AP-3 complex subunit sigma-1-like [Tupaia chinensis]